jgi:hypothetical protein
VAKKTGEQILGDSCMRKYHSPGLFMRVLFFYVFCFCMRGGLKLHCVRRVDWVEGSDKSGPYIEYTERSSKNGRASLKKYQPKHIGDALRSYDPDVVDTFPRYFKHLLEECLEISLSVIESPRTVAWHSKLPMGIKTIWSVAKNIFAENSLNGPRGLF